MLAQALVSRHYHDVGKSFPGRYSEQDTVRRPGIRGLTFHDLRGTAVVTLARAGCNEIEIYSITGHKPGDVRAILTAHYLPRDAEVSGNAIVKLNRYKRRRADQTEDGNLPTALPTVLKMAKLKKQKS